MFKKIVMSSCMAFFSVNALAVDVIASDPIYAQATPLAWSSIITVSGGIAIASPGQNQYLYPYPYPLYEYAHYNSNTQVAATGELFFGLQRIAFADVLGELGLGVAGVSDTKITGNIDIVNANQVYAYSYKVNHSRIELKGRLIANAVFQNIQPYLSASLGVGFNNAHDYVPVVPFVTLNPYPWYQSNTTVAFPYSVGLGLQTKITPNWQVGVGYQFADLGKSYLNVVASQEVVAKGLKLTHLYTNEVLVNLSYLFS